MSNGPGGAVVVRLDGDPVAHEPQHRGGRVGQQCGQQPGVGAQVPPPVQDRGAERQLGQGHVGGRHADQPMGRTPGRDLPDVRAHTAYRGLVDRSPAFLAALASAAVPGLDPVSVEALPSTDDQSFDVAFVQDAEHRRWVVRAPRTDVAGAEMDRTVALLALLGRRLPFAVPAPKGFVALTEGGRAAVYPYLPGHNLDFAELPPGPGIAAELGRAIAALHNTDPAVYEEAGLPSYDADAYRSRRLADLDRAAGDRVVCRPPC